MATTTTTKWNDPQALATGTTRSYYAVAFDAAGNVSPSSNVISLR